MIKSTNSEYGKPMCLLYPGEYYVTGGDIAIATVSALCLVVCLYDARRMIGGMGHFILPGVIGTGGIEKSDIAAYGVTQLEYLFGEFVKLGGDRRDVVAKVFGTASVSSVGKINENILRSNLYFIHEFFTGEKIIVENLDISTTIRRKIVFFPKSGKCYRKVLKNNVKNSEIIKLENEYIDVAFKKKDEKTRVILFD